MTFALMAEVTLFISMVVFTNITDHSGLEPIMMEYRKVQLAPGDKCGTSIRIPVAYVLAVVVGDMAPECQPAFKP